MKSKKLGIIVPYRNRYEHLQIFKKYIKEYLEHRDLEYEVIVVEQDDGKNFNRGKLLNIGFVYAKKLKCDYVVFHDIDMIPVETDYSYCEYPIHLATNLIQNNSTAKITFDDYFGGVTLFPVPDFERINGYSNDYWGWGFEDDDLFYRCIVNKIPTDFKEIYNTGASTAALKFNGKNSYVKTKVTADIANKPLTLFISFYPENLELNPRTLDDKFTVLSIPKLNLSINYNSYKRYNFEINTLEENFTYINSEIKENYRTTLTAVIDPVTKQVKLYQDGKLVQTKEYIPQTIVGTSYDVYLGSFKQRNFFKGLISSMAIFTKHLKDEEIEQISKNQHFGLSSNFKGYNSSDSLLCYFDAKFIKNYKLINLGNINETGNIYECEIVEYNFENISYKPIPFRRKSTFKLLTHEENGYVNGCWKDITTRYNQLRFHNEVTKGYRNTSRDGLSNLHFTEHSHTRFKNQTHVVVGI